MRQSQGWKNGGLPPLWLSSGLVLLEERGFTETNYQNKIIKDRLLKSLALAYWKGIIRHAQAMGIARKEIGDGLGVHRATLGRWISGSHLPEWDKIFGVLALILKEEVEEVAFPRRLEAIWQAISRTIAIIREVECDQSCRQPTREEISCVQMLMQHPQADVLYRRQQPSLEKDILEDLAWKLRAKYPDGHLRSFSSIRGTIDVWAKPYVLFRIGLIKEWTFIDDESV